MSGKKGMKHYPVEKKLEAVRLYYEESMVQSEIMKRLAICDSDRPRSGCANIAKKGQRHFEEVSWAR